MLTPDDHHPHVDVETIPLYESRDLDEWKAWLTTNTVGHYQLLRFDTIGHRSITYRVHFTEKRDATLFKLYFG